MSEAPSAGSLINIVNNVVTRYQGVVGKPNSLADVGKVARVEPITLISTNLVGTKDLYNILHGVLNIYTGYYLQAVSILSAQLTDVRIVKILDKLNPDRDIKTLLSTATITMESKSYSYENTRSLSLEDCKYTLPLVNKYTISKEDNLETSIRKLDTFEKLGTAVGKVVEVEFKVSDLDKESSKLTIPVVVKLDNMIIPSEVIDNILVLNKESITLGSRFKDALAGRIRFIKDFLLAEDLIKKQKKTMIKDPTGYYSQVMKRINNSRIYSMLTGNVSLAGVSSIIVLSNEDEEFIQKNLGGNLTNTQTREIIFNNTSAMMLVVVDKEWERVSIYIRDIDGFSQNSFDDFKFSTDKGNNISDILKAFSLNNAPTF